MMIFDDMLNNSIIIANLEQKCISVSYITLIL